MDSLAEAMSECRPNWTPSFCNWILSLVELSMRSSIGVFEDSWYRQVGGVPTGGSLCVQLANITVFARMRKAVYDQPSLIQNVVSVKRNIDDGAGGFSGTREDFEAWINQINTNLHPFGLTIDEYSIAPPDLISMYHSWTYSFVSAKKACYKLISM